MHIFERGEGSSEFRIINDINHLQVILWGSGMLRIYECFDEWTFR